MKTPGLLRFARNDVRDSFTALDRPRVLIVALSGIGNFLMASPLFRSLKDANPTADIDVLVAPRGTAEIAEGNPRIRRILRGSAKPSLREWRRLTRDIRRERYDVGIITHPNQLILSASLLFFGRASVRIGHRYSWALLQNSRLFLTHGVPTIPLPPFSFGAPSQDAHDTLQNLMLLKPLGISPDPSAASYDFPLSPKDRARADAWLAERHLGGEPLAGIHPGSHTDLAMKRWPAERWSALGDWLAENLRATILVCGGQDEHALQAEICARMRRPAFAAETPLRTTAALIERCACFVANDSGLMHVAIAQRVPTAGLFGPTDERRTAPWGPWGRIIRAEGTHPTYDVARRRPAHTQTETDAALQALSVETVLREMEALLIPRG